jgi:hypothetical protein
MQKTSNQDNDGQDDSLHPHRYRCGPLRVPMPLQHVCDVKEGRSLDRSSVGDRKHGLQELVEIGSRHCSPFEDQRFVSIVSPAVGHAGWKDARLSSAEGDRARAYAPAQHAAQYDAFLMLTDVNVQWRPVAVWREASFDVQDDLTAITNAAQTQPFTGVTILEAKASVHHCRDAIGRASGNNCWL